MNVRGPIVGIESEAEGILRTLPAWFGDEESRLEYARNTAGLPTFVAEEAGKPIAFVSLRKHFSESWEIDCIAVAAPARMTGVGRLLHSHVEQWLKDQGVKLLQVKTLAETHPSVEYAQTRKFYTRLGYRPLEVIPDLWGPHLPVLVMIKELARGD
jgi:GNAT superfamily N-acetyltransferase